ncbi:hypothetical protein DMH04_47545 [Kibdelosporangium aridum]|uniref:Uncharacterized protein n=1 Tax=Kibdelosporangium aridum TaxID=2030 RepID=A0A428YKG2_KIBAR|nr:hypothetical protein [Kibdelosporangium aridum]RSM68147.1 hypothetical protein DMH04_47545 [Kibdelosporangium aridum]
MPYELNGRTTAGVTVSVTTPHFEELVDQLKALVTEIDGASTSEHRIPGIDIKSSDPDQHFIVVRTGRPPQPTTTGQLVEYRLEGHRPSYHDPRVFDLVILWCFEVLEPQSPDSS